MAENTIKEITIRVGQLTGVLQRAEFIEENERIVSLEFDEQINLIKLFLEVKE